MDNRMPVMDGVTALKHIQETTYKVNPVVIVVTASALAHEQKSFIELGFNGFIAKPIKFNQVAECIGYKTELTS